MNNSTQYCYEIAAPPTSGLYYSLRKIPADKRAVVVAIHAFYREIENIIFECHDPQLALVKFNWWRTEITKSSNHPVLSILQSLSALVGADPCVRPDVLVEAAGRTHGSAPTKADKLRDDVCANRLEKMLDGFQQIIIPTPFATFEEVVIQWMRTAGERELLIHEILNTEKIVTEEVIYQLMLVIELVNYIQHLRHYTRHHVIYFPQDEMERFGVTAEMLSEYVTTESIKNLLHYQVEKILRAYAVVGALSREQKVALRPLLVRCEMARATLRAIQESDFKVLENWINLTPLRFWWIAFNC